MPDNILLLMIEQFSAFADPRYADVPVVTPALDRLAGRSVRYTRAYCNAPVCGPSRLSFLTGRYPCNVDAFDNGSELPCHVPTFAHMLNLAGYRTAMCGRMHIHGPDQHRGFEQRLCSEIINPLICTDADFPGPLETIRPLTPDPKESYRPEFSDSPIYRHDEYVTQQACDFLKERSADTDTDPFCLVAGYLTAHTSFKPFPELEPLYHKYLNCEDLPLPRFTRDDYQELPEHAKRQHQYLGSDERIFSDAYHRHEMAWYLARVEYADRQIGRVLDTLESSGLADRTAVIVTSDHGENMGRHGLWGKMNFYEEAERVPLYLALPGKQAGRAVSRPVSLVDILPTLADLADCDIPFPIDGKSLQTLEAEDEERVVFSEYHGYQSPGSMYMALRDSIKYCHYINEPGELYDLRTDPGEGYNRIDDPELAPAREELLGEIQRRVDIQGTELRIAEYNTRRDTVARALNESETHAALTRRRIAQFREEYDEPWWDGGAYMAQSESASINPLADDGKHHKIDQIKTDKR
jgi:choline-sulfatase